MHQYPEKASGERDVSMSVIIARERPNKTLTSSFARLLQQYFIGFQVKNAKILQGGSYVIHKHAIVVAGNFNYPNINWKTNYSK